MLRVETIKLYSKPEYVKLVSGEASEATIKPIKTAHFKYDYSLMI